MHLYNHVCNIIASDGLLKLSTLKDYYSFCDFVYNFIQNVMEVGVYSSKCIW